LPKLIKYILRGQLIESPGSTDGNRLVRCGPSAPNQDRKNSEIRGGLWIPVKSMIHIFLFGHDIIRMVLEFFSDGFCSKKEEINSFRISSTVDGDLLNFLLFFVFTLLLFLHFISQSMVSMHASMFNGKMASEIISMHPQVRITLLIKDPRTKTDQNRLVRDKAVQDQKMKDIGPEQDQLL